MREFKGLAKVGPGDDRLTEMGKGPSNARGTASQAKKIKKT